MGSINQKTITASHSRLVIKMDKLSQNIVLGIYFILAIEYDLYNHFGFGNIMSSALLTLFEIVLLAPAILTARHKKYSHYVMYLFLLLGIACSGIINPSCTVYLKELFAGGSNIKKVFILPLSLHCINDPEEFENKFFKLSVIEGYIHIFCNSVWGYGYNEWGAFNYMTYGMALLTPTCFAIQRVFTKTSKFNIITCIIFELNIIIYGHRGALLVTAVMMLVFSVKYVNVSKKLLIGVAGVGVFILLFAYKSQIVEYMIGMMDSLGLESRTLEKLLFGDITNDSERNTIWGIMIATILNNFPFGSGIGSDRIVLGSAMRMGLYAHNFILELCLDFGLVIGLVVVIWIVMVCYKSLTKVKDENWAHLIQPILIPSVITLLTSASIWQYWLFWFSLGLYYDYFDMERRKRRISHSGSEMRMKVK